MIYLDHHAGTPLTRGACDALERAHGTGWANPQSVHAAGRSARHCVDHARDQVAAALGAKPADVVFTSGGTEACNLALAGLVRSPEQVTILTTSIEHPAMAANVNHFSACGAKVHALDVPGGRPPTPAEFAAALDGGASFAVVQWVNHEVGTIFPIADYARDATLRSVPLIVDACQAFGRVAIDLPRLGGVTALVVAASKVGGPKGAGALWVERCRALKPVLRGGAQERGLRPGTPDVSALAGFGAAASELAERLGAMSRVAALRDRLERGAVALGGVVNGSGGPRVASVTNLAFRGWRGEHLVAALDIEGVCASSGAACSSGLGAPSPVLLAMHPDEPWRAESALRLSLGPETTQAEVDDALLVLQRVLSRV